MTEPAAPLTKPSWKDRLKALFSEYGGVAIGVFAVLWIGGVFVSWKAISLAWTTETTGGLFAKFLAAYAIYKTTTVPRVIATIALTPIVAKILERLNLRRPKQPS